MDSDASVFEDTFERASQNEGVWRGRVGGNGLVHLHLFIYRKGRLFAKRYMGSVTLRNEDTFFVFKSAVPEDDEWTWVIKAYS